MKSICCTNQKGGVGKSTTCLSLAAGLHNKGHRVLIVDFDPQANVAFSCGVDEIKTPTLYDVLKGGAETKDALRSVKVGLDCLTVGLEATVADMELAGRTGREYMLREALQDVRDDYDYCVIDTPPNLGVLCQNALTAADYAVIPLNLEIYSLQGIYQLGGYIKDVRKYTNSGLKVSGLLLTKYNDRLTLSQVLKGNLDKAAEDLHTVVFDTRIRESVAVKECQLLKCDIYEEAPKATATLDYLRFVDEFMEKEGLK